MCPDISDRCEDSGFLECPVDLAGRAIHNLIANAAIKWRTKARQRKQLRKARLRDACLPYVRGPKMHRSMMPGSVMLLPLRGVPEMPVALMLESLMLDPSTPSSATPVAAFARASVSARPAAARACPVIGLRRRMTGLA